MFNNDQKRLSSSLTSSSDSESSINITTNFTSVDLILSADTDESDLQKLVEDDTFLKNVSKNDSVFPELTDLGNINPKRISGSQLVAIINNLRNGPMPNIPQTEKFNESIATLSQILEKTSKEITIDELAQVLFYTLETDHSCTSEHSSETDSFLSYAEISKLSDTDSNITGNNTGMELNSIIRELRGICQPEKNIESESSPDWHCSLTTISKTPKNTFKPNKVAQSSNGGKKKEYFPMPNLNQTRKSNETIRTLAHILNESSTKITFNEHSHIFLDTLPTDYSYVSQDSSATDSNNTGIELDFIIRQMRTICQPEKNIEIESSPDWHCSLTTMTTKTPKDTFKPNKITNGSSGRKRKEYFPLSLFSNVESHQEDLNLQKTSRETVTASPQKNFCSTDRKSPEKNSRKSFGIDPENFPSVSQLRKVFSPSRRAKDTLNLNKVAMRSNGRTKKEYFPMNLLSNAECLNKDSSNNNMPSSLGVERKRFPYQRNSEIQELKGENTNWNSPNRSSNSKKFFGNNSTHLSKVSQLRKLYSPNARRAEGVQKQALEVPRIPITKCYPERNLKIGLWNQKYTG